MQTPIVVGLLAAWAASSAAHGSGRSSPPSGGGDLVDAWRSLPAAPEWTPRDADDDRITGISPLDRVEEAEGGARFRDRFRWVSDHGNNTLVSGFDRVRKPLDQRAGEYDIVTMPRAEALIADGGLMTGDTGAGSRARVTAPGQSIPGPTTIAFFAVAGLATARRRRGHVRPAGPR